MFISVLKLVDIVLIAFKGAGNELVSSAIIELVGVCVSWKIVVLRVF